MRLFSRMGIGWPDEIDEVIGGDLAAGVAYLTPAKGVVITPMAPLGLRDRRAGTVTVTTSLGLWKKLDRIRANPSVAVAYHAPRPCRQRPARVRARPGPASFSPTPDRDWLESIGPGVGALPRPDQGGLAGRWLEVYYWQRVAITIEVAPDRRLADPGLRRRAGRPRRGAAGSAAAAVAAAERHRATDRRATGSPPKSGSLPHTLVGWAGADGLPMVDGGRGERQQCRRRRARRPRRGPARGRPPRRPDRPPIRAADDRPGAAPLHRLARCRRRPRRLRAAHPGRLPAARLEGRVHARQRHRHPAGIRKARERGLAPA